MKGCFNLQILYILKFNVYSVHFSHLNCPLMHTHPQSSHELHYIHINHFMNEK